MNHSLAGKIDLAAQSPSSPSTAWRLSDRTRIWLVAIILGTQCLFPIWISIDDHPLYAPDEGRYGSVTVEMLRSGDWLVPVINGHAHLTKPPLVYWAQAAAHMLFKSDELALRLPSLIAATLIVLVTFRIGRWWGGTRRGLLASGLLSLMPLHVFVGRLAITDSILALCWIVVLGSGTRIAQVAQRQRGRSTPWVVLLWSAAAVGLMTKGPLALVPVGLVIVWLLLTGRRQDVGRLRIIPGLLLAVTPLGVWAWLMIERSPEAMTVWRHEVLDRVAGHGDHTESLWYYIPVFIAGFFPASATLSLPGVDYSWRSAWEYCRRPHLGSLLALAVVLPLFCFSLIGGKLATYLLPIGPPLALLVAAAVESRFIAGADRARNDRKARGSILAVLISTAIIVAALAVASLWFIPASLWTALLVSIIPLASTAIWVRWPRIAPQASRRLAAIVMLWLAGVVGWVGVLEFEDSIAHVFGTQQLMEQVHSQSGLEDPIIATVGYQDPTLFHYLGRPSSILKTSEIEVWCRSLSLEDRAHAALLVRESVWRQIEQRRPEVTALFEPTGRGTYRFNTPVLILRPRRE